MTKEMILIQHHSLDTGEANSLGVVPKDHGDLIFELIEKDFINWACPPEDYILEYDSDDPNLIYIRHVEPEGTYIDENDGAFVLSPVKVYD